MSQLATSSGSRLSVIGVVYGVALVVVIGHLFHVMVFEHEDWLVRSYQNRWAFRDVPSVRGALLDRQGRVIVADEPTFELSCVYERVRLFHPVGAAIHGATLASRAIGQERRYGYRSATLGPEAAFADLMATPAALLLGNGLPKPERVELARAAVTVLAACSHRTRSAVAKALRTAAAADPTRAVGDAQPDVSFAELDAQYRGITSRLRALDASLLELRTAQLAGVQVDGEDPDPDLDPDGDPDLAQQDQGAAGGLRVRSLLEHLDGFRVDSLDGARTQVPLGGDKWRDGELLERIARPLLRRVPFDLAAALRVAAQDQPGLRLEPALERRYRPDLTPTLRAILGSVGELGRNPKLASAVDERVELALDQGLDELVPDDLLPTDEYRQSLRAQAERSYARVLRARERGGVSGIESMLDDPLAGTPGLRLVERDARAREQLLWSRLRVSPGQPVTLTVDLDLQALVELQCEVALAHWQAGSRRPERIDVALAMIDAQSGDVLALGGAPHLLEGKPRVPAALAWRGVGFVGSIVKPLFALEQLRCAREALPHKALADFVECSKRYPGPGRTYRCDHWHGDEGKDPVTAIGKSCNVFFYQVAEGLGPAGLRRALYRFGLQEPDFGDGDGRYQARPAELPARLAAAPTFDSSPTLDRGIGYGIQANPLAMARAYAALATGMLPTLGLRRELRPRRPLGADPEDLALVQAGLRYCVERGTAREIDGLRAFSVLGKTGTAQISRDGSNNGWFAGYLPGVSADGVQLAFCAVVYVVPDGVHGADVGGQLIADVLGLMAADPQLQRRYLPAGAPAGGDGR